MMTRMFFYETSWCRVVSFDGDKDV